MRYRVFEVTDVTTAAALMNELNAGAHPGSNFAQIISITPTYPGSPIYDCTILCDDDAWGNMVCLSPLTVKVQ